MSYKVICTHGIVDALQVERSLLLLICPSQITRSDFPDYPFQDDAVTKFASRYPSSLASRSQFAFPELMIGPTIAY